MLNALEQKVEALIAYAKEMQTCNKELRAKVEGLKIENASLEEENLRLLSQIELLSGSAKKGQEQLESYQQERERTRAAVDDLLGKLKTIDVLAECE